MLIITLCVVLAPMLFGKDNTAVVTSSPHDLSMEASPSQPWESRDWLYYDDGVAYATWGWYYAGNGWGVQFNMTEDVWIDSIAAYHGSTTGGNLATYRIYDGVSSPSAMRWELASTTVTGNSWNYFEADTTLTHFGVGDNVWLFYIQVGDYPDITWLGMDGAVNAPAGYLWYFNTPSTFGQGNNGGDWMLRIHVTPTGGGPTHDVATLSYDSPTLVPENTTYDPMATFTNYGDNAETFDVTCEINPGAYTSTKTVTDLAPGADEQVTFDPFQFVSGLYTATVYTQLSGDENPGNDTLLANIEATDWLYYDDGTIAAGWAWYYADNGWGAQFPAVVDLWVDSIAAYIYDASWPSPGGNDATFRIYDGASQPTNLRQEWLGTTIVRGAWNLFPCDTTLTHFMSGDNIYFFYVQYLDAFDCPALAIDAGINAPSGMLWYYNGPNTFGQGDNGGDWLLRVHIIPEVGIAEWFDPNVPVTNLRAPTIIGKNGATIEFVLEEETETELVIYDATGRLCKTLVSGLLPAGKHIITPEFNLASGIYFINLQTKSGVNIAKKTLLVK